MAKHRIKLSDELKAAISGLSDKEKNRLLYRLIPKDDLLVEQLVFKLLEEEETREERRADLLLEIRQYINRIRYRSPGFLLLDLRKISGRITRHVRVARDKYGEVALNLFMLNHTLDTMGKRVARANSFQSQTFDVYLVKRAAKVLKLLDKIHLDYQLDFDEEVRTLGRHLHNLPNAIRRARQLGLDLDAYFEDN